MGKVTVNSLQLRPCWPISLKADGAVESLASVDELATRIEWLDSFDQDFSEYELYDCSDAALAIVLWDTDVLLLQRRDSSDSRVEAWVGDGTQILIERSVEGTALRAVSISPPSNRSWSTRFRGRTSRVPYPRLWDREEALELPSSFVRVEANLDLSAFHRLWCVARTA